MRKKRSEFLAAMTAGEMSFSEALAKAEADENLKRTLVKHLIRTQPGYGKVKAGKVMAEVGIAENRRVAGLGSRQRDKLVEIFG